MRCTRAWALVSALCAITACSSSSGPRASRAPESNRAVYNYRQASGTVRSVPAASETLMFIQVDDIPGFKGPGGQSESISKMTLPFRIARNNATPVHAGDRIVFDVEVDWDAATPGRILDLRPAPARR